MRSGCVLAIDQGTTSVRATVLDANLTVRASWAQPVDRSFPRPGWVELDAEAVVAATERVAVRALELAGVSSSDVAGVGMANQGETVVVWDRKTGRPIAPAIGWQCRRTEPRCSALLERAELANRVRDLTGLPIDPYFSATKIAWLLDETSGARARAERGELLAGTMDAFTMWRFSGGKLHVTDPSTSCRTLLASLADGRWNTMVCELFGVPRQILPEVVSSDADLGTIGIGGAGVPLRGLLCDQPAALLGTGCIREGDVKCTYGTGAFLQVNTGSHPAGQSAGELGSGDGLLRSIAWELSGRRAYLLEGSILSAGDVLTWLQQNLGILASPDEIEGILAGTSDSAGVVFVPALSGLGAPRWTAEVRAAILGLHRGARREHVIRAALEGIAHQVADVLELASRASPAPLAALWADGGLSASPAFLSLQANVAGCDVRRARGGEATTRGVALVVARGAGLIAAIEEAAPVEGDLRLSPSSGDEERAAERARHARVIDLLASEKALRALRADPTA